MLWKKYEYQFPKFFSYDEFCCIFLYYGKLMGKPMYFGYEEVTIGCESYEEKSSIPWEKYEYLFSSFTPYDRFLWTSPYYEKLMGKPMHFPYDEVYDRMGI